MMVYVISLSGNPIAPTSRCGHVRKLLEKGKARVVRMDPFTIQLLYENTEYHQECTLGIDAGSRTVGLSVTTERSELIGLEVDLREDIATNISSRREARRTRRSRKLRHRKARFANRKVKEGWLAPSVQSKADAHMRIVKTISEILPISRISIEVGQFDMQLIKNPSIEGTEYQQGPQMGFWNVREYVLCRDGHMCQHCKGRSKDPVLNVHHLESRMTGGNSPDNLITLCETCHKAYHRGEVKLKVSGRKSKSLRDAAFMNVVRTAVYRRLKASYPDVHLTYGYVTKSRRISHGIEKTHCADAFCIAGNLEASRLPEYYRCLCVPRHTRSLHVQNMKKGGVRRSAVAPHWIKGTRLQRYDYVKWNGIGCFIAGSTGGRPVLRDIDWNLVTKTASVNAKTVKFLSRKKGSILYQLAKKQ